MMFLPRTCLGIYPLFPHYYVVAFSADKHEFQFLWQQRFLFSERFHFHRAYHLMSIPWSLSHFFVLDDIKTAQPQKYKYLGLASGEKRWLGLNYSESELQAYLESQGPWVQRICEFESEVLALWSYAYWLLAQYHALNQRVLWVYEHPAGCYFLYGRNENLWVMQQDLGSWIDKWPKPERVISFNAQLTQAPPFSIVVEYLPHQHYAWVMAHALAIRGAYAVF